MTYLPHSASFHSNEWIASSNHGIKHLPSKIVNQMKVESWDRFTMDSHTKLWKKLDAKNPAKGYGAVAVGKTWCWYETWLNRVREECEQHPQLYRSASSS